MSGILQTKKSGIEKKNENVGSGGGSCIHGDSHHHNRNDSLVGVQSWSSRPYKNADGIYNDIIQRKMSK